ncbi:MAG: chromosomal replication initiator protein DnaA [Clostridiales bacterium]|nr:chromosomal replication initiator protein DnaA [Clostridiales bacterium]
MRQQGINELAFRRCVEPLDAVALQHGILVLQAPDEATRTTLKEYYFDHLRTAAQRANTQVLDVLVILPAERGKYTEEEPLPLDSQELNPNYTFDTFVVGNSNNYAHAAAQAVVEAPGKAYNPLFIYANVGLGKTHLMHAVGNAIKAQNPGARILYATSETFTNELIEATRSGKVGTNVEFRQRYRNVDLLMIDDIQFLAKKPGTQEEFFNTFNALHSAGKQIIVSADRLAKEIPDLDERLRSRFQWGLAADIHPPNIETRIAILRNRAQHENMTVPDNVISFIAENMQNDIRQLEGSLSRVLVFSRLRRVPVSLSLAKEALKDQLPSVTRLELSPARIKDCVAEYYGISVDMLMSQRRDREVVVPRQIAMYLCHTLLSMPYQRISALFGRSDHTTAMNACERINALMREDSSFRDRVADFKQRLQQGGGAS